eukprot:SAG31_NODE_1178_length_9531_cov_3.040818_5_plen_416_part_00
MCGRLLRRVDLAAHIEHLHRELSSVFVHCPLHAFGCRSCSSTLCAVAGAQELHSLVAGLAAGSREPNLSRVLRWQHTQPAHLFEFILKRDHTQTSGRRNGVAGPAYVHRWSYDPTGSEPVGSLVSTPARADDLDLSWTCATSNCAAQTGSRAGGSAAAASSRTALVPIEMSNGRWRLGRVHRQQTHPARPALDGQRGCSVLPIYLPPYPLHASVNPPPLPVPTAALMAMKTEPTNAADGEMHGADMLGMLPESLVCHALRLANASGDELRALAGTSRYLRELVMQEFGMLVSRWHRAAASGASHDVHPDQAVDRGSGGGCTALDDALAAVLAGQGQSTRSFEWVQTMEVQLPGPAPPSTTSWYPLGPANHKCACRTILQPANGTIDSTTDDARNKRAMLHELAQMQQRGCVPLSE